MGSGIAQILASSGLQVLLYDQRDRAAEQALKTIQSSLEKLAAKDRITSEESLLALRRIKVCQELEQVAQVDVVVEAIFENLEAKCAIFRELDEMCPSHTLLLTNTSSLPVTEIANATTEDRKPNVAGMHFFNPVPLMKLVEVIRTPFTSEETFRSVWDLAEACGKSPVETRDTPGFLFNRLILPYLNEAIWAVYEGAGKVEEIDKAMLLGGNMPIGPLALCDMVGLDIQLHALTAICEETGEPKYRPCPLNKQMVRAGYLGRKSGQGFYDYRDGGKVPTDLSVFRF